MRLCKDCVHCSVPYTYHPGELGGWSEKHWDRASCRATVDFVTGGGKNSRKCSEERNDTDVDACGPGAKKFEALPPPPPRPPRAAGWRSRLFR